jgi:gliding motility-associated protein GldM
MRVSLGSFRTSALSATLVVLIALFAACSNKANNLTVIEALDESLTNSNTIIARQSEIILSELKNKLDDPPTETKARFWYPKAMYIKKLSADITTYIESIKTDLKKEAGLKTDREVESFDSNNTKAVGYLFFTKGKGKELYENLKKYKEELFKIDSQMTSVFEDKLIIIAHSFDSSKNKQKDFTHAFFDQVPSLAAIALLNKFQNNIKIAENRMLVFCNYKTAYIRDYFDSYSAIVAQSSRYVRPGEKIEITAGVGAFSRAARPEIIINGQSIEVDESGMAIYKVRASSQPGKHSILVKIDFLDQGDRKESITKNVEYTVVKEN